MSPLSSIDRQYVDELTEIVTPQPEVTKSVTTDTVSKGVTAEQAQTIFRAVEDGASLREAGALAGVSHTTAWRLMRSYEANVEAAAKYMAAKARQRVEDWDHASAKAASRGDHRPAKDWLLHVHAIDPVAQESAVQVAILIGTPEQPIRLLSPQVTEPAQVIDAEPESPYPALSDPC